MSGPAFLSPTILPIQRSTTTRTYPKCTITPPKSPSSSTTSSSSPTKLPTPPSHTKNLLEYLLTFIIRPSPAELRRRFGPIYKSSLLGYPFTVVSDINLITQIYKAPDVYSSHRAFPPTFEGLFGPNALFSLDGQVHSKARTKMIPAFSPQFFPAYFEKIRDSVDVLYQNVEQQMKRDGKVRLEPLVKDHFLGIILHITTGVEPDDEQFGELRDQFLSISNGLQALPFSPAYKKAEQGRKTLLLELQQVVRKCLRDRREEIERLRNAHLSMPQMLKQLDLITVLCASSSLSTTGELNKAELENLADQILLLWFAGFSTQSTTTLCAMLEMLNDDTIWNRLQAEQDALITEAGDSVMTSEQVMRKMTLLDSYIDEILRLYPAAAAIYRRPITDVEIMGYGVKRDTAIALDLEGAQRDEKYFKQPNQLIVDRFLDSKAPSILTFGILGGKHFCIGAALARITMRTTLAGLLRGFDAGLAEQSMEYKALPERKPKSGVVLSRFERRSRKD